MSPRDTGCHYCGSTERELRPYGPGGEPICFPCMKAEPGREKAAKRAYGTLLDANEQVSPSGVVTIGGQEGPRPATPDEVRAVEEADGREHRVIPVPESGGES